jgi:hypothetical protein
MFMKRFTLFIAFVFALFLTASASAQENQINVRVGITETDRLSFQPQTFTAQATLIHGLGAGELGKSVLSFTATHANSPTFGEGRSYTIDFEQRIPISRTLFVLPGVRYTASNFDAFDRTALWFKAGGGLNFKDRFVLTGTYLFKDFQSARSVRGVEAAAEAYFPLSEKWRFVVASSAGRFSYEPEQRLTDSLQRGNTYRLSVGLGRRIK